MNKFICVGVNVNSYQGMELCDEYAIEGSPYMAIMWPDTEGNVQPISHKFADEININTLFEMCDTAYDLMSEAYNTQHGIPEFNVADSNLRLAETEEVLRQIETKYASRQTTGFVESRSRERQVDPNTGIPFGMSEKQYEDMLLKDKQKKELEEAMEADRIKLQAHKEREEEEKRKRLEEVKMKETKEQEIYLRDLKAKQMRENLPEEPSEDNPDA